MILSYRQSSFPHSPFYRHSLSVHSASLPSTHHHHPYICIWFGGWLACEKTALDEIPAISSARIEITVYRFGFPPALAAFTIIRRNVPGLDAATQNRHHHSIAFAGTENLVRCYLSPGFDVNIDFRNALSLRPSLGLSPTGAQNPCGRISRYAERRYVRLRIYHAFWIPPVRWWLVTLRMGAQLQLVESTESLLKRWSPSCSPVVWCVMEYISTYLRDSKYSCVCWANHACW